MADNKKAVRRYLTVIIAICILGGAILATALNTMLGKANYWRAVSDRFVTESISIAPIRGNILSSDGQLMVASIPEFRMYMDFKVIDADSSARVKAQHWRDSVFDEKKDSIATGLSKIFPDKSKEWFLNNLQEGRNKMKNGFLVYPKNATFIQYLACCKLPLFRETPYKGGFHADKIMLRKKPFGSLAARTMGNVSRGTDTATSGLEWCYDTLLRGEIGWSHRSKVRNKKIEFVDKQPVNGHDLVSTIDVSMQDVAEKAIVNKLKEVGGKKGVVILMEVATGDIKAMVSMTHIVDSATHTDGYYEIQNDAINALWEPGSTFKTGSIMVALEDGHITPDTKVDTKNGDVIMHGRHMKDHNWRKGGYGTLSVTEILGYSSNVGVSYLIDKYYHEHPEKYVEGLYREGVGIPLGLPMGADPQVRMPKKDRSNWSESALAWMSIGYETSIPPISTVTFYNAIANNGKMVRPRFIKAEREGGQVVREFPVEVIKEKICSKKTLTQIQDILEKVVSQGLGKKAGNGGKYFPVSGKTGTAQVATNGSYEAHRYMVSFCGYFPSNAPKYSCIVCILKDGLPASGGGQCGPVFSEISQFVMNKGVYRAPKEASDSMSDYVPMVYNGNLRRTTNLLSMLNVPWRRTDEQTSIWCTATQNELTKKSEIHSHITNAGQVPSVIGMGARDAVYALQSAGLKVHLRGTGRVEGQSIPAGTRNAKGKTITLNLK